MAPLSRGLELLESAVSYALAGAAPVTPQLLPRPTPCPGWDLETLLDHVGDSIGVLTGAMTGDGASTAPPGYPGPAARPAPATSSSPSSAASRAPKPRPVLAAPKPGTRLRPARKS